MPHLSIIFHTQDQAFLSLCWSTVSCRRCHRTIPPQGKNTCVPLGPSNGPIFYPWFPNRVLLPQIRDYNQHLEFHSCWHVWCLLSKRRLDYLCSLEIMEHAWVVLTIHITLFTVCDAHGCKHVCLKKRTQNAVFPRMALVLWLGGGGENIVPPLVFGSTWRTAELPYFCIALLLLVFSRAECAEEGGLGAPVKREAS